MSYRPMSYRKRQTVIEEVNASGQVVRCFDQHQY